MDAHGLVVDDGGSFLLPPVTFVEMQVTRRFVTWDAVASQIVEALLDRGLTANGHTAVLSHYGDKEANFLVVGKVTGPGYELTLNRPQGRVGGNGVVAQRCAGLFRVQIPGVDLRLYTDGSGPLPDEDTTVMVVGWLREHVLAGILSHPLVPGARESVVDPPTILYPMDRLGPLMTWCDEETAGVFRDSRLRGYAVVRRHMMVTVPCAFGTASGPTKIASLPIPGFYPSASDTMVAQIRPKWANGLTVYDYSAYQQVLQAFDRPLALGAFEEARLALLATATPIHEYAGDFRRPVVMVRRHFAGNEVQIVSGPWPNPTAVKEHDSADVARSMRVAAGAEFDAAVAAWCAYLRTDEPVEARWAAVGDAVDALVLALRPNVSLVGAWLAYKATHSDFGEWVSLAQFMSHYAGETAKAQFAEEVRPV